MAPINDWHSIIAANSHHLPPDVARQLREIGFIVIPGPTFQGGCERLSDAYDLAVATADPADVHIGSTGSSTRINDFVNRGSEFDGIYIHPPLLIVEEVPVVESEAIGDVKSVLTTACAVS